MALPPFSRDFTGPVEQAWRRGDRPADDNRLSPNPNPVDPKKFVSAFVNQRFQEKGFWDQAFAQNTADASQQKIDDSAVEDPYTFTTKDNTFQDKENNKLVFDFMTKYKDGISRTLINDPVTPESLIAAVSEPAAARLNTKDPNTASKFPSQGVQVG